MPVVTYILLRRGDRTIRVDGRSAVLGRSSQCEIVCADAGVSRRHCELIVTGDGLRVRDLDSRHGTWVDGNQVRGEAPLQPGSTLALGRRGAQFKVAGGLFEGTPVAGSAIPSGPPSTVVRTAGRAATVCYPADGDETAAIPGGLDPAAIANSTPKSRFLPGLLIGLAVGAALGLALVAALR